MTFREKLEKEHPERIAPREYGGCHGCPITWGYEYDAPENCCPNDANCTACWDREIPEEKTEEPKRMTFREKLKKEHPNAVKDTDWGGCVGCPVSYDYEEKIPSTCYPSNESCTACWDREMPGTEDVKPEWNPPMEEIIDEMNMAKKMGETPVEAPTTIKDSGARREFESGAVRDIQEGKGRCDLLPLDVVANMTCDEILEFIDIFKSDGDYNHLLYVLREAHSVLPYSNAWDMLLEVSIHFEDGAKKYGEYNWQKGIPVHCYIDSAVRHYLKHLRGDVDEYHDRAFVWNILCCIWTCIHKPELNEYKSPETTETNNN